MRRVTVTKAWAALWSRGYEQQYEGGWVCSEPGDVLVGRALTAMYMPSRPDLLETIERRGAEAGAEGEQIHWPINALTDGDVYVADVFGRINRGAVMGDNLAAAIHARSGNGVVHHASVRDWDGIRALPGFTSFARGQHPTFAGRTVMLAGLNCPLRIGAATVMPGDVVLGRGDGVMFIPAHLARLVIETAELLELRDRFGKQRLREARYTPGQVDNRWTEAMEADFLEWVKAQGETLPVSEARMRELLEQRTW